jgi:hypothetical protein
MNEGSGKTWFGAKTVLRHPGLEREPGKSCYEERVVLIHASDEEEALKLAEQEANEYADGSATKFRLREHLPDGLYAWITGRGLLDHAIDDDGRG